MDAERLLLSKIVETGDLRPVLDTKLTSEFFADEEHREVFSWMLKHWGRYGKPPGAKALHQEFPTYELIKGKEPYQFYLDEVRRRRKYELTYDMLTRAAAIIEDDDVEGTVDHLRAQLLRIDTEVTELRDTNIVETWQKRLEQYAEWKEFKGILRGIPSGFPSLDKVLRGFQPEQLITFIGVPKVGKSTMLMRMAIEAHQFGSVPLFIGFEMSNEEQEARHDSMVSGVSYPLILSGSTTAEHDETLHDSLRAMRDMQPFILSSDPEGTTVGAVASKIEQYKPDIVFIDGVYMMKDEEGGNDGREQLTNITRSLKRLARRSSTPIVISTQVLTWKVNKARGLDMNAIGYSSSFAQDSDVILGVEHTDDEDEPIKKVSIVQARSAPRRTILINWDWEHGEFTEMEEDLSGGAFGSDLEDEDAKARELASEDARPKPGEIVKKVSRRKKP